MICPAPIRGRAKSFLELLLQPGKKQFGGSGEYLVFLPDHIQSGFQTGSERSEHKIAVCGDVQKFVQRDCEPDPVFHQERSVENQIERGHDIQLLVIVAEPLNAGCPDSGKVEKN